MGVLQLDNNRRHCDVIYVIRRILYDLVQCLFFLLGIVMSSPDKYPPTPLNHEKRHQFLESRCTSKSYKSEDVLPEYSVVMHAGELGDETRFQAISRSLSTDV